MIAPDADVNMRFSIDQTVFEVGNQEEVKAYKRKR